MRSEIERRLQRAEADRRRRRPQLVVVPKGARDTAVHAALAEADGLTAALAGIDVNADRSGARRAAVRAAWRADA